MGEEAGTNGDYARAAGNAACDAIQTPAEGVQQAAGRAAAVALAAEATAAHEQAPQPTIGPDAWARHRRGWSRKRKAEEEQGSGGEDSGAGSSGRDVRGRQGRTSRDPVIPLHATYDDLLGSSKQFDRPIPLNEMIWFLRECWMDEGLYGR